ncbi:MAG: FG-GAP repeat protein, partial [Phycisphaerae bacterium]
MSQQPFVAGFFLILACITFSTTAQSNAQLIDCNANGIPDICDVGPCTCGAGDNLPDAILTIEISTDFFPEETTWELTDQTVGVVASGGPLDLPNTLIAQDVPVCSASCYDFTIFDVFGDGICCGGFYNLLLDGVLIATGTSFGFEETITNIGDCVVGTSEDCNADGIPDECEPMADCNGNSIRDSCDIANGTSSDCNANGIIDFCEIADGTSQDCNANGFPDVCDLMPFPQQAKLNAGDAEADDWFGVSVSISGDTAVIGSTLDDDAGHDSGSAYIFVRTGDTWTQQAKLTA